MYLYLGQDTVINTSEIVGIFDLENTSMSRRTKDYLAQAQKKGLIREVSTELPKSYVVCQREKQHAVYLSQISPATLEKRSHYFRELTGLTP